MTSQQKADAALREYQLEKLLRELELDITTVVTAQYDPHPFEDNSYLTDEELFA